MKRKFMKGGIVILDRIQEGDFLAGFEAGNKCTILSMDKTHYRVVSHKNQMTGYALKSSVRDDKTEDELYLEKLLSDNKE